IVIPLAEVVLRKFTSVGIKGSSAIVQHLCLIVGTIGAAIAARHNRLLSLSSLGGMLKGRANTIAGVTAGGIAFGITTLLGAGSARFVVAEREAGQVLVYGIPIWCVQLVLPIAFG